MQLTRGYISCSIVTTGPDNFQDNQLQQWGWANNPPIQITASNQIFSATWSVTGSGSKFASQSMTSPTGQVHTQSNSLAWTENGFLTVQMQVRISSSNQVFLTSGSIVVPGGLTGTQQLTIDGVPQTPGPIGAAVYGLPLPAVQWNGPQYTSRPRDVIGDPLAAVSPPPSRIGSLIGNLSRPWGGAYSGSLQQPNLQVTGYQAPAGTISTATWNWRIYF
jgi:hypothetical protein